MDAIRLTLFVGRTLKGIVCVAVLEVLSDAFLFLFSFFFRTTVFTIRRLAVLTSQQKACRFGNHEEKLAGFSFDVKNKTHLFFRMLFSFFGGERMSLGDWHRVKNEIHDGTFLFFFFDNPPPPSLSLTRLFLPSLNLLYRKFRNKMEQERER